MSAQDTPPTSNHLTDAVKGQPYVRIESNGTPQLSKVTLSDGRSLGLVQSVTWSLTVGEYASCCVETIASPAELKALLKDTTIAVRPAPDYNPFRYLWDWTCAWAYNLFTRP